MTREEAIKQIKDMMDYFVVQTNNEIDPLFDRETVNNDIEALEMAIKALEQEPKWIPVSKRLPEESVTVLGTTSFKYYIEECKDNEKLDEAIKHYEELSKERYLFNPHNKDLYEWLKELRDRRKRG